MPRDVYKAAAAQIDHTDLPVLAMLLDGEPLEAIAPVIPGPRGRIRRWQRDPIAPTRQEANARGMQRTRRQTSLMGQVQAAMTRLDASRTSAASAPPPEHSSRHGVHEQLVRWESEGGASGDGSPASRRPSVGVGKL